MMKFLTGAAALALAASAVHADPGGGKGGGNAGNKGGGGHAEHAQGGGKDHAPGGNDGRGPQTNAGGKADHAMARVEHGNASAAKRGNGKSAEARVERADRGKDRSISNENRGRDDVREIRNVAVRDEDRDGRDGFDWNEVKGRGLVNGCPPGLAKKNNGCTPPGLARDRDRDGLFSWDRPDWWGLSGLGGGRYSYYDGNLVRLGDGNRVLGYVPLLGGALAPGNVWPSMFEPVALPSYYQDYYGLGTQDGYRYYDDAIYHVDPKTSAITSIAALLTGDDFAVGQPLPSGYGVYNVPYSYRDRYVDGPDAMYRYSDGYVYQVDPKTQLIQTVIELLT
jgi:hypothetical protein